MNKMNQRSLFWLAVFVTSILFLGYGVDRVTHKYFSPYSFELFLGFIFLAFVSVYRLSQSKAIEWNLKHILVLGIGVRGILFLAEPNLSDDYFRFIWDGTLIRNGINPFVFLPSEIMEWPNAKELGFTEELYNGFNSQQYYSVYPPVNQFIFFLSAFIGNGNTFVSVLVIRACILLAEFGSIYALGKLIQRLNIPIHHLLWYVLNPLIILEFTVNLHFESIMVAFMLGALYALEYKRYIVSGLFWALAICTKLIPIIYLTFLLKRFKVKEWLIVGGTACIATVLFFLPFWNPVIPENIQDSLDKYFGYFEFNAGIPYLIRYIGYEFYDYSILFRVMPVIKKIFVIFVVIYGVSAFLFKKNTSIYTPIYYTAFIYFLLAGILHPWYITFLIPLGILSKNYSGIFWSLLIFLSYSAYQTSVYKESMWIIGIEFGMLFLFLIYEKTKWGQRYLQSSYPR